MSEKEPPRGSRTFSLLKTLGSTAVKAGGEAFRKRVLGEEDNAESAAAQRLAKGLDELKGAAMKLGQMLSLSPDDDLLPKTWKMALTRLQSEATAKPWSYIEPILCEAFGEKWPFKSVEEVAVHAASIGQVHRGELLDGTKVAIKVRYPGLENSIRSDLDGMRKVLKFANIIPSRQNYDELASTVEQLLIQELDFDRERQFCTFYRNALSESPEFYVPRVIEEASTSTILTTEWIEGENFERFTARILADESKESLAERDRVGRLIFELLYIELYKLGHMQTDPNPGNFLVLKDGRLGLVDFGATQPLSSSLVEGYRALTHGCVYQKRGEISRAAAKLGFLQREDSELVRDSFMQMMTLISEPFLQETYSWKNCMLAKRVRDEAMRFGMLTKFRAPPNEVVFLNRRILGTQLLLENLGPTLETRKLVARYLD